MSPTVGEKTQKRKRGARGKKKEEIFFIDTHLNEQQQQVKEVAEEEEPLKKKTRRSKKGKGAIQEQEHHHHHHEQQQQQLFEDIQEQEPIAFQSEAQTQQIDLDIESRNYFVEIEKKLQGLGEEFPDEEEQHLFIEAVYREVEGKHSLLACDYEVSRILERLFKVSFDYQVRQFAVSLMEK
jgi:hypothetical protein